MTDTLDAAAAIACRSLEPLLDTLDATLAAAGATSAGGDVRALVAEAYARGHRDVVRHAVAEIAPAAASHGLRLWLGPELCDGADRDEGRAR
ncbi:MAG TPA: hypothetical protein VL422_15095 [Miltoncostaea sp.]|nr:hypothetical protein [Miltoncostaea sp.]